MDDEICRNVSTVQQHMVHRYRQAVPIQILPESLSLCTSLSTKMTKSDCGARDTETFPPEDTLGPLLSSTDVGSTSSALFKSSWNLGAVWLAVHRGMNKSRVALMRRTDHNQMRGLAVGACCPVR
jgi:hypothetical protein